LECATHFAVGQDISVTVKTTYESPEIKDARPIIVHTYPFFNYQSAKEGSRLYRRRNDRWGECEGGGECGCIILDDPDVELNVSTHDHFESLLAGETWTFQDTLKGPSWGDYEELEEAKDGDRFRYVFKGSHVDWWDWDSKEKHKNTIVKVPCWIAGRVVDPADNGGRPELVVPCSESVEDKNPRYRIRSFLEILDNLFRRGM
jgi:hypothetical protein